tara:strand:+ start:516 stop:644 length:129 start_codon:yes stop_codon:yes gene_type:complete
MLEQGEAPRARKTEADGEYLIVKALEHPRPRRGPVDIQRETD